MICLLCALTVQLKKDVCGRRVLVVGCQRRKLWVVRTKREYREEERDSRAAMECSRKKEQVERGAQQWVIYQDRLCTDTTVGRPWPTVWGNVLGTAISDLAPGDSPLRLARGDCRDTYTGEDRVGARGRRVSCSCAATPRLVRRSGPTHVSLA